MSKEKIATIAFAGFALLLAFRDVAVEVSWEEKPTWFSFTMCATILTLSVGYALFSKQYGIVKKLMVPGALPRAIALGTFSGSIYLGIFFLIQNLGAGLWGLIDYGLIPLATAIVGAIMFREKLTIDFLGAFLVYSTGIVILKNTIQKDIDWLYIGIALVIPVLAAISDGWTKWLLDEKKAGLTKSELLAVRFLPAVIVLYLIAVSTSGSFIPQMENPLAAIIISVIGGWLPLMLLCTGLAGAEMKKLAVWEFMIPALTFFGTLHRHEEHMGYPILGAILVLSGIIVSETKVITRLFGRNDYK